MLEPTTFPMATPGEPARAAVTLVRSSGSEVPKPTMVRPITIGESRIDLARLTEPFTRISPPPTRARRPMMIRTMSIGTHGLKRVRGALSRSDVVR